MSSMMCYLHLACDSPDPRYNHSQVGVGGVVQTEYALIRRRCWLLSGQPYSSQQKLGSFGKVSRCIALAAPVNF